MAYLSPIVFSAVPAAGALVRSNASKLILRIFLYQRDSTHYKINHLLSFTILKIEHAIYYYKKRVYVEMYCNSLHSQNKIYKWPHTIYITF